MDYLTSYYRLITPIEPNRDSNKDEERVLTYLYDHANDDSATRTIQAIGCALNMSLARTIRVCHILGRLKKVRKYGVAEFMSQHSV